MREMKDTGVVWCPTIPKEWHIEKVKNYFYISKDLATETNPTVLKLARSGICVKDVTTNEGQMAESYDNYNKVKAGDLLLNPMDLYSGANCNVSEIEGVISPAYTNLRLKASANSKFYDYYFKTQYWAMAMFAHGKGVSYDNRWTINAEGVKNYEIPVPSIEEQNAIVESIQRDTAKVDALIANQEAQIEKLKAYKQSLITEVVTKGLDPNVPMKDSGAEWIEKIPESWNVVPLKTLFDFGKGLPITKENLVEEGIPVISYGQIHAKWNSGVTIHEELKRFVNKEYLETNPSCLVKKGDFIIADTSEDREGCGNAAYVDTDDTIFAGYHTVILISKKPNVDNKYLAYLFLTDAWRSQLRKRVSGIKVFSVSRKFLSETSVLIPDNASKMVELLDEKCSHIDKLISIKQQKIERLNQYKKSIIYEYVTGKKEV